MALGHAPSLALLFGMLYLITLEIPPFPLILQTLLKKLFYIYLLSINMTL